MIDFIIRWGLAIQFVLIFLALLSTWKKTVLTAQKKLIARWSQNIPIEFLNRSLVYLIVYVFQFIHFEQAYFKIQIPFLFFILLLDFIFYWRHRFYHKYLWAFHRMHHEDENFDVTLSFRFHPVEVVIHAVLLLLISYLLSLPFWYLLVANQIFSLQALLSHLNIQPQSHLYYKIIENFFILPSTHKNHHSVEQPNQNYGFLFSFWDRLFKTDQKTPLSNFQIGTTQPRRTVLEGLFLRH